ncbi:MAG: GNAT family N-acetyltransferase [Fibrobacteres bacterium]|nr:GNAT family N-acetyltransferase [Fibrobacterota bacterium]
MIKPQTILTSRYIIRPIKEIDFESLHSAVMSSQFPENLPLKEIYHNGNLEKWFNNRFVSQGDTNITWSIAINNNNDKCIGQISITEIVSDKDSSSEDKWALSYWLHPHFWNQGIISECIVPVIDFCFNELKIISLWAGVSTWNFSSIKILEKCSFIKTGTQKDGFYINGIPQETFDYELDKIRWLENRMINK